MTTSVDTGALWAVLANVPDPEVPVLSVVDLGIVRDFRSEGGEVVVDITPTYSGCPAMRVIETEIVAALERAGVERVRVRTIYQPAWTTDWISAEAKERLRQYGIAPPGPAQHHEEELIPLRRRSEPVPCPWCGSRETELRSEFGATACKAIHFCNACRQPFEHFKPL
ncbi:MAG TPA: 1,2-phenylacetyl-CoA epoxidase subunit PaaD [Gemmatimonadaceae bacterium]